MIGASAAEKATLENVVFNIEAEEPFNGLGFFDIGIFMTTQDSKNSNGQQLTFRTSKCSPRLHLLLCLRFCSFTSISLFIFNFIWRKGARVVDFGLLTV